VAQLNTAHQQLSIPITILFGTEVQAHIALKAADHFYLVERSPHESCTLVFAPLAKVACG
jgi:hypothetical protein